MKGLTISFMSYLFAKRCPLFSLERGLSPVFKLVLLGVGRELRPRPIREWVADLFYVKTRGIGRGDFVTLIRVSCQKAVQSQRMFPVG